MTVSGRIIACIACLLLSLSTSIAQSRSITVGSTVDGALALGETHRYSLTALELTLLSFRAEALDDGLDLALEVFDGAGRLVISNDDADYPNNLDAAIQVFVMPRTSTYTVAVRAIGERAGAYRLHVMPGYDRLALRENPVDNTNWEVVHSDTTVNVSDASVFALDMRGLARFAGLVGLHLPIERDLYFETTFDQVNSSGVWQVGLLFRYLSPSRYHRLLLSKRGFWRVDRIDGDEVTELRGWTGHPAIQAGADAFRLGVLVSGQHYDVVYNGQLVGAAWDRAPPAAGSLGVAMMTDDYFGGTLSLVVKEVLVTLPSRIGDRPLFPQRIVTGSYYGMAASLTRQQLVPVGGEIKLTVPESRVRHRTAGVSRLPIASNFNFAQFAMGARVTLDVRSDLHGGCGLYFHFRDADNFTLAYVTNRGEYGVARRDASGFEPGIYGDQAPLDGTSHYLLLVVSDDIIHYYLDERHVGSLDSAPRIGGVGIATVNYDAVETGCDFDDLWLLSLDD